MDKQQIVIIILSITLIVTFQYVIFNDWIEEKNSEIDKSYQEGYNQGGLDLVLSLIQETEDCNTFTLTFENTTRILFDFLCLEEISE